MSSASPSGFSIPHRPAGESARPKDEGDGIAPDDRLSATVFFVFFAVFCIIGVVGTAIYYLIN